MISECTNKSCKWVQQVEIHNLFIGNIIHDCMNVHTRQAHDA